MIRRISMTVALLLTASAARAAETLPLPTEPMPDFAVAQYDASPTPTPDAAMTPAATPMPVATPAPVAVAPANSTKLKIGGVIYTLYSHDLSKNAAGKSLGNKNGFDVSRAYINLEPSWGDDWFARVTVDVARATTTSAGNATINTTGSLIERAKYAYLGGRVTKDIDIRFGLQQTPWIDFEEGVWEYRVLTNTMAESFYGMSSSDFGLSTKAKLLGGALDIHAGVYNGETYQKPENNKYKEVSGRVTYTILPMEKDKGLKASVYYGFGLKGPQQDSEKERIIGMISFQNAMFTAGAQYLYAQDSAGAPPRIKGGAESVFGHVNVPVAFGLVTGMRVLARVDLVDPNTDKDKDGTTRIIGGVAFKYTPQIQLVLDYQSSAPQDSAKKPTQGAFAHIEAKF
jgi:hypothetical protein